MGDGIARCDGMQRAVTHTGPRNPDISFRKLMDEARISSGHAALCLAVNSALAPAGAPTRARALALRQQAFHAAFAAASANEFPSSAAREKARAAALDLIQSAIRDGRNVIGQTRIEIGDDEFRRRLDLVGIDQAKVMFSERILIAAGAGDAAALATIKTALNEELKEGDRHHWNSKSSLAPLWFAADAIERSLKAGRPFDASAMARDMADGGADAMRRWLHAMTLPAESREPGMGGQALMAMARMVEGPVEAYGAFVGVLQGPVRTADDQVYRAFDAEGSSGYVFKNAVTGNPFVYDPNDPGGTLAGREIALNVAFLAAPGSSGTTMRAGATTIKGAADDAAVNISAFELGPLLGKGTYKKVHALGQDEVIGVFSSEDVFYYFPRLMEDEVRMLRELREIGLPTVQARGPVTVDGLGQAIIYRRYAQGSKDVVRVQMVRVNVGEVRIVGGSPFLNHRSVADLQRIRRILVDTKTSVRDLQFLIAHDGRMVVADPLGLRRGVGPSKQDLELIDRLIQVARGDRRYEMMPDGREEWISRFARGGWDAFAPKH